MYERTLKGERVLIVCSFWSFHTGYALPEGYTVERMELLLGNYPEPAVGALRPYEAQVWRVDKEKQG